jgi:hypothetical protein
MTKKMKLCYAAFGLAVVAGSGPAHAQTVITRQVVNPAVDTMVTQQPAGTVITRRPLATVPAETVVEQPYETVETIQTTRPARTVTRRVTTRQVTTTRLAAHRNSARTVRHSTIRSASLTPAQQRTIYSVIRRERVVPTQTVTERIVTTPVQRIVTAPAYPPPPAYVTPGYEPAPYTEAVPEPRYRYGEWSDSDRYYESDRYPDQVVVPQTEIVNPPPPPPAVVERVVTPPAIITIGDQLPATVPLYAMPPRAIARVPSVSGYRYAYVNGRVLLVDPNTDIVMAALRQ